MELNELVQIVDGEIQTIFDSFLNEYKIFDESYRNELNTKIIKHFYFQEIGFETCERFVFEVNRKMGEIMVKYNQLYESEIKINPLINFKKISTLTESTEENENEDLKGNVSDTEKATDNEVEALLTTGTRDDSLQNDTTASRDKKQETTGLQDTVNKNESTVNSKGKDVKSDTPTSQLLASEIDGDIYASEVSVNDTDNITNQSTNQNIAESQIDDVKENDSTNQTQTTLSKLASDTSKTNEKSRANEKTSLSEQVKDSKRVGQKVQYVNDQGSTISESELLIRYRETFLNIDMDIIKDLQTMFMLILG